jgi:hypothetical protein
MNLPNQRNMLQDILQEYGYCDWYAMEPGKLNPVSQHMKCMFVNFKERRKAQVGIPKEWFHHPDGYNLIGAVISVAIDNCSVPALASSPHRFFFVYPQSWSESRPIFPQRRG